MRRILLTAAVVVGCFALTSCTAPISYGIRLNADGTVDYANCPSGIYSFDVDYIVGNDSDYAEWNLIPDDDTVSLSNEVIRYGVVPEGYSGVALDPPADWTSVEVAGFHYERNELIVDDWIWEDYNFDWIPGQPCMDVD